MTTGPCCGIRWLDTSGRGSLGRRLSRRPLPPFAQSFTPPLQHFIFLSPSPFPNSRNEFHIHLRRVQWPATGPQPRFMFQCLGRSGWRKTRSTCQRTCVSVYLRGDGGWEGETRAHRMLTQVDPWEKLWL